MSKKNNMIIGAVALAAIGVSATAATHVNRTEGTVSKNSENNILLTAPSSTIPLNQSVIRTQTWVIMPSWNHDPSSQGHLLGAALSFDTNSMKINLNDYAPSFYGTPYIGYEDTNNMLVNYTLLNSNLKELGSFQQNYNMSVPTSTLNGESFNYGNLLAITSSNNVCLGTSNTAGTILPGNSSVGLKTSYYEITKDGLMPATGVYGGKVVENGKVISSGWATIGNDKYYVGKNGDITTGTYLIGNKECVFNNEGVLQSEKIAPTLTINSWPGFGGNTLQLIFDNGIINSNGQDKWLGSNNPNSKLTLGLYSSNGSVIKSYNMTGEDIGNIEASSINGQSYSNGDIILINSSFPDAQTAGNKTTISTQNQVGENSNINIDGQTAYTITSTGLTPLDGYHELNGVVYNFTNGVPAATTAPELSGTGSITVPYGSNFNPMQGVKLTDAADPNAKIEVSGTVNTNSPGTYTLTYTVKDNFGRIVKATRIITVAQKIVQSEIKDIYWTGTGANQSLVINGNVTDNSPLSWKVDKTIVIKNSQGVVVKTINTVPVNWYSKSKDNYSGYQCVIPSSDFSGLDTGSNYQITVEYNGQNQQLDANEDLTLPENSTYNLSNSSQGLCISKVGEQSNTVETLNWNFVAQNLYIKGKINNSSVSSCNIVFKNSQGKIVGTFLAMPTNEGSVKKDGYLSYMTVIPINASGQVGSDNNPDDTLDGILNSGQTYQVCVQYDGKTEPLKSNITIPNSPSFDLGQNENGLTITKLPIASGAATVESSYAYNGGFIINSNLDLNGQKIPLGAKEEIQLISNGTVFDTIKPTQVNWYSNSKDNYSGMQIYLSKHDISWFGGNNITMKYVVSLNGKSYVVPIKANNIDIQSGDYNMSTNSNGELQITNGTKAQTVVSATATLKDKYKDGENTIENYALNIPNVPAGSTMKLELTNNNNQITTVSPAMVNWYSGNKDNYNGTQISINSKLVSSYKKAILIVKTPGKTYNINLSL